jgi:hypothetical protein
VEELTRRQLYWKGKGPECQIRSVQSAGIEQPLIRDVDKSAFSQKPYDLRIIFRLAEPLGHSWP